MAQMSTDKFINNDYRNMEPQRHNKIATQNPYYFSLYSFASSRLSGSKHYFHLFYL
jgi:hypothetical protein